MRRGIYLVAVVIVFAFCAGVRAEEKVEKTARLVVQDVVPGSQAEGIGVQRGDVLVEYDGKEAHTMQQLLELRNALKTDSVEVTLVRDGGKMTFRMAAGPMGVLLKERLPEIEYEEDATVIQNIPVLDWSTQKYNSFLAAVELVANHLGINRDYVYLNGVSGAAFRLHFFESWCPSSPDPTCGYNSGEEALKALGLSFGLTQLEKDDTSGQHELRREMITSLDGGIPVIAIDLIQVPEWGVITGYHGGGEQFVCRDYFARREGYDLVEKFPWAAYLISDKEEMPSDESNYLRSFAIVLENLTTVRYGEYLSGLAAFDEWIKSLESGDLGVMDSTGYEEACHANAWIYDRLIHDREMAVEYLEDVAQQMPQLSSRLKRLQQLYREELKSLEPSEDVVVYGFNMKTRDDWSPKMRSEAAERLKQAKTKEEAALQVWQEIAALTAGEGK